MCTVTYIPNKEGYLLTSNRDEKLDREPATQPIYKRVGEYLLLFPKDPLAGGTWIAQSDSGTTACLLNGAIEKHLSRPPYRKSRGIVVLDLFRYDSLAHFSREYNFNGIEPFTLVLLENEIQTMLSELIWTGEKVIINRLPAEEPRIWSSVTLYNENVRQDRRKWFANWLDKHASIKFEGVLTFHEFGGLGKMDEIFNMKKDGIWMTKSITQVQKQDRNYIMRHKDMLTDQFYVNNLKTFIRTDVR